MFRILPPMMKQKGHFHHASNNTDENLQLYLKTQEIISIDGLCKDTRGRHASSHEMAYFSSKNNYTPETVQQ